jgi:hypothetical protein
MPACRNACLLQTSTSACRHVAKAPRNDPFWNKLFYVALNNPYENRIPYNLFGSLMFEVGSFGFGFEVQNSEWNLF